MLFKPFLSSLNRLKRGTKRIFASPILGHYEKRLFSTFIRGTKTSYVEVYSRVEQLMQKEQVYLRHDLDANQLAQLAGTNRVYLSRSIRLCSGLTFRNYLCRYRVNYAMNLFMHNPSMRVVDLSYTAGFNSAASFTNAFKRITNVTPGIWCMQYRKSLMNS